MNCVKCCGLALMAILILTGCDRNFQQPDYRYAINNPADIGSRFPNLYQNESGTVYMSWILGIEEDMYAIQYAEFEDGRWREPNTVYIGRDLFVNWADFPSVVGKNGSLAAAHWLKDIEGGPLAYNVNIAFPAEGTRRWNDPVTPHLDGTPTEHGFVSMEPIADDRVLAIWLDGRNTDGRGHDHYSDITRAMTLRSAEITTSGEIERKREVDPVVCDCCQTDMAVTEDGIVAVYRDRTEDEIRDISIARYDLETGEWSEPETVSNDGWEIMGCPVNGPRVVAAGSNVAVAWYTGANDEPSVLLARSADGGRSFEEPVRIAGEEAIGRVDLVMTGEGSIYVSWMDREGKVNLSGVQADGEPGAPIQVGTTTSSRSSGFPRIKKTDDGILFAWTQTEPQIRVRTAIVPIE